MASTMLQALALALLATLAAAVSPDERTYTQIAAQNTTGQWALSFYKGVKDQPSALLAGPLKCPSAEMEACYSASNPAPYQPLNVLTEEVFELRYNFTGGKGPGGAVKTYNGGTPIKIAAKLCYTNESYNDRPWRKKNKPYPRLSKNCIWAVGARAYPAGASPADLSGSFRFNMDQDSMITTATWFAMLQITCDDGEVCAFETTENKNNIQSQSYNPITKDLLVSSIILSITGPLVFIVYFVLDWRHYSRTGKPLQPGA